MAIMSSCTRGLLFGIRHSVVIDTLIEDGVTGGSIDSSMIVYDCLRYRCTRQGGRALRLLFDSILFCLCVNVGQRPLDAQCNF